LQIKTDVPMSDDQRGELMPEPPTGELEKLKSDMASLRLQIIALSESLRRVEKGLHDYLSRVARSKKRVDVPIMVRYVVKSKAGKGISTRDIYDIVVKESEYISYSTFRTMMSRMKKQRQLVDIGRGRNALWVLPTFPNEEDRK
jgi:hypothetical protein